VCYGITYPGDYTIPKASTLQFIIGGTNNQESVRMAEKFTVQT